VTDTKGECKSKKGQSVTPHETILPRQEST
jgi:hypothetical protein